MIWHYHGTPAEISRCVKHRSYLLFNRAKGRLLSAELQAQRWHCDITNYTPNFFSWVITPWSSDFLIIDRPRVLLLSTDISNLAGHRCYACFLLTYQIPAFFFYTGVVVTTPLHLMYEVTLNGADSCSLTAVERCLPYCTGIKGTVFTISIGMEIFLKKKYLF